MALSSLVVVAGYAYSFQPFYSVGSFIPMAIHTALAFLILISGILSARADRGLMMTFTSQGAGGIMVRRLLPAAIVLPLVLGWLRLWGQRAGLYSNEFGAAFFAVSIIFVFVALIWWNAHFLMRLDTERQRAEGELKRANDELALWVAELEQRNIELAQVAEM